MLDLQTRIHFHEIKLHRLRLVIGRLFDDEFHGARAHIVHSFGSSDCGFTHLLAQCGSHARRRGFFEHLLMATLHRAVTLKQIHAIALRICKNLNLNMAWTLHIFFNQDRVITKTVFRFTLTTRQGVSKVCGFFNDAHALATTTRTGFDQHGVAHGIGFALQQLWVLVSAVVARHQRHTCFLHALFGFCFQTHSLNSGCRRTNKHQALCSTGFGEVFVLT